MVGGQALDSPRNTNLSPSMLCEIHHLKTGALIAAAAEAGAICANASTLRNGAIIVFAKAIGLAFQVTDDILDVTGDSASLGKTAGKDWQAENRPMSARWV